jgi:SPP1 gp7 family putative phage head morphogenesis protein
MTEHAEFYRNAIDLNRYSNGVTRRIVRAYNDVILDTVERLAVLDPESITAARLRAILAQLKESLATWSGTSTQMMAEELQGLALLQRDFMVKQLEDLQPPGAQVVVRTVEISPQFAQAVVTSDPTQLGIVSLSDQLPGAAPTIARVTVADGVTLTLPNGEVVRKAFDDIGTKQAELFSQAVRNGLLTGESTESIVRRLKGRLDRERLGTVNQQIQQGGLVTARANNQIRAIVRSSITQVNDAAMTEVALANPDVTKRYRYTAVLDSRTSPICRSLDGKIYNWGEGPAPPLHFNCRSMRVPLVKGFAQRTLDMRQTYGEWLQANPAEKEKVFGSKTPYFNYLSKRYGPTDAVRRFVREDGSELTLKQLASKYPDVKPRVPANQS